MPQKPFDRVVSTAFLRPCKLWDGSHEFLEYKYGSGLRRSRVVHKIGLMEACDDLTPDEQEYLEALRKTLKDIDNV